MKRAIVPALMTALLLTACGGGLEERIEARRDALAEAECIAFTTALTADLDTEVFACTLDVARTMEETALTVVEEGAV